MSEIPFYIGAVHDLFPDFAEELFDLTTQSDYFSEQFKGEIIDQIGLSFQRQGKHDLALNKFAESLVVFVDCNNIAWQIRVYLAMAESYANVGNKQAALRSINSANALAANADDDKMTIHISVFLDERAELSAIRSLYK